MAETRFNLMTFDRAVKRHYGALLPIFAMAMILCLLVPLPTWLMDFLLIMNITASAIVVLTVMYIDGPLDFTSFPTLLLGLTLFRLVLNVGTTRLVLSGAATNGSAAAGRVVQQFGEFVASGSLVVAVIIFAIIVIIQFIVITKGATRIAEVAARFTLDGMPGKQMAIDADLNAQIINEEEAKRRRAEITAEADFYGAMDGASKFVRGDAIAGIIITFVNIVGGVLIGTLQHGMPIMDTIETYTILTIGDGLVSQIPAFIVSIAAAMIVTRSASRRNLGEELLGQISSQPIALAMTMTFLFILALTPLPKAPLILMGGSCGAIALVVERGRRQVALEAAASAKKKTTGPPPVESHLAPDPLGLDLGYGLIRLVDRKQGGDLLDRIANLRRQMAEDLGLIVPPIRIRDEMKLSPNQYRVKLKGLELETGETMPGHLLAIHSGEGPRLQGIETREPTFGLPATWIEPSMRHDAEHRGNTVVDASTVLVTHLTETIRRNAAELLTRQEVGRLLDKLKERAGRLVEEIVPHILKPHEIHRVLQGLLREGVPIRDLELILETISDVAGRTRDPEVLIEYARVALARTLCQLNRAEDGKLHVITLDSAIEDVIRSAMRSSDRGTILTLPPNTQTKIVDAMLKFMDNVTPRCHGRPPAILCSPPIRSAVREMAASRRSTVVVLSYAEIVPAFPLESHGSVVTEGVPGEP